MAGSSTRQVRILGGGGYGDSEGKRLRYAGLGLIRVLLLLVFAVAAVGCRGGGRLSVSVEPAFLPADGFSGAEVRASRGAEVRVVEGGHSARLEGGRLVAGINPGRVVLEASAPGRKAVRVSVEVRAVPVGDRFGDGTPDFLRLDDEADRATFVGNFAGIARTVGVSGEITDCSSFVRFAYREALRGYEGRAPLKYQFPFTPLGARVFQTLAGPAEFADAETLARFNTYRVSKDVARAAVGDLLFFRQSDQKSPWHVMVVCDTDRVCYHTGPDRDWPGEIRRPTLDELRRHELPKWRPLPGNSNFLGVFRWNILRQDS